MEDVLLVDLFRPGEFDVEDCTVADPLFELVAFGDVKLLGIVEALDVEIRREDDGGGNYGTGEGSAASFIGPGPSGAAVKHQIPRGSLGSDAV